MRVLILSDANSIHTKRWVKSLSERGVEIILFSLSIPIDSFYSKLDKVKVYNANLQSSGGLLSKLRYMNVIPYIKKLIRDERPDIVHAHYASSYGLLGAFTKPQKVPYIVSVWGSDVYDFPNLVPLGKTVIRYNLKKADYILSTSHVMAKETKKYTDKNIYITPFGVEIDKFKPYPKVNLNEFIIGNVKTLRPKYGIDILIKAAAKTIKNNPQLNIKVEIYGDGPQKEELMNLSKELEINRNVDFKGFLENSKLPDVYNSFSVAVSPSVANSESFGVVAVEAMACGCPVVTSDADGFTEVVENNRTGFIVPKGNVKAIAEAIQKFIDDPALREKMGRAGRQRVLDLYDWNRNVETMMEVYEKVMQDKKRL